MQSPNYSEDSIQKLDPREHIRKRPGMYVGGTETRAMHHLIYEVMDHMVEEVFVGRCQNIWLTLLPNRSVNIRDNSYGLPLAQYKDTQLSQLEALMLKAYAQKSDFEPHVYPAKGLNYALRLMPVNALSAQMVIENRRDGYLWRQEYNEGLPKTALIKVHSIADDDTGTQFTFTPDFTIFDDAEFDRDRLTKRCRELAYQVPELTITLRDERLTPAFEERFHAPDGLKTLIRDLHDNQTPLHEIVHIQENVVIPREGRDDLTVGVEIAFQFIEGHESKVFSYANTVATSEGGTHLAALKAALLSCLNENLERWNPDHAAPFTWPEIANGLSAVIAIRHPEPQFISPTRVQLGNGEIYGPVAGLVYNALNPDKWNSDVEKIVKHLLTKRAAPRR